MTSEGEKVALLCLSDLSHFLPELAFTKVIRSLDQSRLLMAKQSPWVSLWHISMTISASNGPSRAASFRSGEKAMCSERHRFST